MTNPQQPHPPGQQAGYPPHPGSHTTPPPQFQQPPPPGYGPQPGQPGFPPAGPPKKDKGNRTVFILLGVIFGGMILMCGVLGIFAANAPKTTTTIGALAAAGDEPAADAPAPPAAPEPGATKDNPAPIGTSVSPAKDWTVVVNSANLDATAEIVAKNMFNKPKVAGNKLVTVNVTVRNGSNRPGSALTEMKLGALIPSGQRVDTAFAVVGVDQLNLTSQLQPGGTQTGTLVYELAPADIPATVLLAEPVLTLDVNEDQRFLAIQ